MRDPSARWAGEGESCVIAKRSLISCCRSAVAAPRASSWMTRSSLALFVKHFHVEQDYALPSNATFRKSDVHKKKSRLFFIIKEQHAVQCLSPSQNTFHKRIPHMMRHIGNKSNLKMDPNKGEKWFLSCFQVGAPPRHIKLDLFGPMWSIQYTERDC